MKNFKYFAAFFVLLLFLLNNCANKPTVSYSFNEISNAIETYINAYYYWKGIYLDKNEDFYPYDKKLKIKIIKKKNNYYGLVDELIGSKNNRYNRSFKVQIINNLIYKIDYYYNESDLIEDEINNKKNVYETTIILPSNWEPKYPAVEGKKKEMVDGIKKVIKEYYMKLDIKNIEQIKRMVENKKIITLYLRNFYLWDEEIIFLVSSKQSTYYGYINLHQDNKYSLDADIQPLTWQVPNNFKLEGYKGDDERLQKFAKHYIKETIEFNEKDIKEWETKYGNKK